MLLTVHAVAVFHVIHNWSHDAALVHTGQQTAALTGLNWSWGLYVNYAFITLWLGDCAWWWLRPEKYARRSLAKRDTLLALFLFMFFNGAVVFAPWPARGVGLLAVTAVIWSRMAATIARRQTAP